MSARGPSLWERAQLVLLRWWGIVLGVVDRLFRVQWGERLLARMARRWQAQIDELDESLARLEAERQQVQLQAEALALQTAALYLGSRSLLQGELRFDPADPREEEILDASIDLLVKERLAVVDSEEVEAGHFVYYLEPDWPAIRARLAEAAARADGETAAWLREGLQFIDDTVLPDAANA